MRFYYYQEECVPYYFRISDQPTDFERRDVLIHYLALVKPVIGLVVTHGWGLSCVNTKFDIRKRTRYSSVTKNVRLDNGKNCMTGRVVHFFANSKISQKYSRIDSIITKY